MTWLWITTFGIPGIAPGDDVLEARVGGRGHRHRVALAGQADGDPQDVRLDRLRLGLVGDELDCRHHVLLSTDPRQRVADELVHDPPATERRLHEHHARRAPSSPRRSPPPRSPPRAAARSAASAASACSGATTATSTPSLATCIGSIPSSSAAPATPGGTGTAASRTSIATPEARASSLRTDATPPRVASRRQRRPGPAALSSASTAGHSGARVGLDLGAELELAAGEHDRRAVQRRSGR